VSRALCTGTHGDWQLSWTRPDQRDRNAFYPRLIAFTQSSSFYIPNSGQPVIVAAGELPNLEELGVIISRKLLDMLGGAVTVENRTAAGILVTLELPLRPAKE